MSDMDNDPIEDDPPFIGRIEIDADGEFFADVFGDINEAENAEWDLRELLDTLDIDLNDKDVMLAQITQDVDADELDMSNDDLRGPYDKDEVKDFLDETGWWGIADIFYDEEYDDYYIDINYDDGANS